MTPENFDDKLDLFYGGATANRVTVYARLREKLDGEGWSLTGTVRGPHCLYSTTLPATIPLIDAGPGETLLAKALVPDPCYWTAELPFLYDVHVELKQQGRVVATTDRLLGIRSFGPRGKFFYDQGKRRVIRAASCASGQPDLPAWHATPLDMIIENPSDTLCEAASRTGVLLIASIGTARADILQEVRRLSRHAAVAIVGVGSDEVALTTLRRIAPNLVFAFNQTVGAEQPDCLVATVFEMGDFAAQFAAIDNLPVLACHGVRVSGPPEALRVACDTLQGQLAPDGDFAGYGVLNLLDELAPHV